MLVFRYVITKYYFLDCYSSVFAVHETAPRSVACYPHRSGRPGLATCVVMAVLCWTNSKPSLSSWSQAFFFFGIIIFRY